MQKEEEEAALERDVIESLKLKITITLQNTIAKIGHFPDKYGDEIKEIIKGEDPRSIVALGCVLDCCVTDQSYAMLYRSLGDSASHFKKTVNRAEIETKITMDLKKKFDNAADLIAYLVQTLMVTINMETKDPEKVIQLTKIRMDIIFKKFKENKL